MTTPDSCLAAATNGEVFRDDLGEFSRIRRSFLDMPQDVRLKKLAGHLIMAAQAGQYNFKRCISHGETGGAQLAMIEFADHAMSAVFLLNRKYRPFYKWAFRAMRELEKLSELADTFEFLISSDNEPVTASAKADIVEDIASMIITELQNQGLTDAICGASRSTHIRSTTEYPQRSCGLCISWQECENHDKDKCNENARQSKDKIRCSPI